MSPRNKVCSPQHARETKGCKLTGCAVRALVEQRLQTELAGEKRVFLDRQIDEQLANM